MFHVPAHKQIPRAFEVFISGGFEFLVSANSQAEAERAARFQLDDEQLERVLLDNEPLAVEPERAEVIAWRNECRRLLAIH